MQVFEWSLLRNIKPLTKKYITSELNLQQTWNRDKTQNLQSKITLLYWLNINHFGSFINKITYYQVHCKTNFSHINITCEIMKISHNSVLCHGTNGQTIKMISTANVKSSSYCITTTLHKQLVINYYVSHFLLYSLHRVEVIKHIPYKYNTKVGL